MLTSGTPSSSHPRHAGGRRFCITREGGLRVYEPPEQLYQHGYSNLPSVRGGPPGVKTGIRAKLSSTGLWKTRWTRCGQQLSTCGQRCYGAPLPGETNKAENHQKLCTTAAVGMTRTSTPNDLNGTSRPVADAQLNGLPPVSTPCGQLVDTSVLACSNTSP